MDLDAKYIIMIAVGAITFLITYLVESLITDPFMQIMYNMADLSDQYCQHSVASIIRLFPAVLMAIGSIGGIYKLSNSGY